MTKIWSKTLIALLVAAPVAAQDAGPTPATNQDIFRQLVLDPPSAVRTGAGAPGPAYWQNHADYTIRATLDTAAHRITGSETIHYVNNSPEPLTFVWLQLDQNLFRPGSRGARVNAGNRWRGSFPGGGFQLSRVDVTIGGAPVAASRTEDGTRLRIDLGRPLAAHGGELELSIDWSFVVGEYGADRMGRFRGADGWVYEIAQWYPRMYVFDDVNGWNQLPISAKASSTSSTAIST